LKTSVHIKSLFNTISFIILFLGAGCEKDFEGDREAQALPETFAVVDSVRRDSNNLLVTTVTAYWWGESKTGFIEGYEVSTDNQQTWQFTKEQKGSFLLNLPLGVAKGELPIFIRAIDNIGQKDPTPARMVFPIKNSAPKIAFDFTSNKRPVKSFPVVKIAWTTTDVDGRNDIDRFDLYLNDATNGTYSIPGNTTDAIISDSVFTSSIRIEGIQTSGVFQPQCRVFTGSRTIPLSGLLNGIVYDAWNYFYLKAVDKTGNNSLIAKDSIWIKKPVSDLLIVNALSSSSSVVFNFYANRFKNIGGNLAVFDTLIGISTQFTKDELYNDAVTQTRTFNLFNNIIWLTDDANTLATCQQNTAEFFNNGGRMFITAEISNEFPATSSVLSFTPVEALVVPPPGGNIRMNINELMTPHESGSGWPILKSTSIISNSRPFITFSGSSGLFSYDSLCRANLINQTTLGTAAWNGPANVLSMRKRVATGKADLIFCSLPLQRLNGNNNIDSLFRKALLEELEF
jgi:hypothetical protein